MKAIDPLLKIGTVTNKDIKQKNYGGVLEEAHPPQGVTVAVKNIFNQNYNIQPT